MSRCPGVTFFVRFTMVGDEVRRCDQCSAEYVVRIVLPRGRQGEYRPDTYMCGALSKATPPDTHPHDVKRLPMTRRRTRT